MLFILLLIFRFWLIHSLNNFPFFVRVSVSILSLPTERYKSKDISITTIAIKKWTTLHENSRRARFHHIIIFFLEFFWPPKIQRHPEWCLLLKNILQPSYPLAATQNVSDFFLLLFKTLFNIVKYKKIPYSFSFPVVPWSVRLRQQPLFYWHARILCSRMIKF